MANLHPNQLSNQVARSDQIVVGADPHKHAHVAAVMGSFDGIQAIITVATDRGGFRQMLDWSGSFGQIIAFGIEDALSDRRI